MKTKNRAIVFILLCGLISGCDYLPFGEARGAKEMDALKRKWDDGIEVAKVTSVIVLDQQVANLQAINRELESLEVSECLLPAKQTLQSEQKITIQTFMLVMSAKGQSSSDFEGIKDIARSVLSLEAPFNAAYEEKRSKCVGK